MTTKTKTKIEEKFIIVSADDDFATDFLTEAQVIKRADDMRTDYITDEVDPDYIKECFPNAIKTLSEAKQWLEGVGEIVINVPEKLNETQRILKRTFENNSTITGEIKRKEEDYFDQGSWVFSLKILDIDENMNARLQLEAKKLCPSRAWDNGIKVVAHPRISLYRFDKGLDTTIAQIIHKFFRSDKGISGYGYKVLNYSL